MKTKLEFHRKITYVGRTDIEHKVENETRPYNG